MTLEELVKNAYENSKAHGFHDKMPGDDSPGGKGVTTNDLFVRVATLPEKLALIHSEVSEALEEYREKGENCLRIEFDTKGKPVGLWSELADVVIRVGDLCGMLHIDLNHAIIQKMIYNKGRPFKHGKVC